MEYNLTDLARGVADRLRPIPEWAHAHMDEIEAARERFDARPV